MAYSFFGIEHSKPGHISEVIGGRLPDLAPMGAEGSNVLRLSSLTFHPYTLYFSRRSSSFLVGFLHRLALRMSRSHWMCPLVFSVGDHPLLLSNSIRCLAEPGLNCS